MAILPPRRQVQAFQATALVLVVAALATFVPLWAPLVLAAWVASMARPLLAKIENVTRGRTAAAGGIVVALVLALLVPLTIAVLSLSRGAFDLAHAVLSSSNAKNALEQIVSGGQAAEGSQILDTLKSPERIVALAREHGAEAMQILGGIAGAFAGALLGLFVFLYAVFVFLVDGPAQYAWLEDHAPFDAAHTRRLAAAFQETGRGLFVGIGLTGLAQGLVATGAYLALGVPRALVLGMITCVASLIPSVGTALVWVPVAAGLAIVGKTGSAAILVGIGVFVIGTVDNVLRPVFARFGDLDLSTFVLLVSIFGGLAMFGAWGLLLGPLFARLAKEALVVLRTSPAATTDTGDEGPHGDRTPAEGKSANDEAKATATS